MSIFNEEYIKDYNQRKMKSLNEGLDLLFNQHLKNKIAKNKNFIQYNNKITKFIIDYLKNESDYFYTNNNLHNNDTVTSLYINILNDDDFSISYNAPLGQFLNSNQMPKNYIRKAEAFINNNESNLIDNNDKIEINVSNTFASSGVIIGYTLYISKRNIYKYK